MNPLRFFIIVISGLLLANSGCMNEPRLNKAKFADLDRTGKELKAAFSAGDGCEVPDAVLQRLDSGTEALKDKTASKAERDLLAAYVNLAAMSRDALLLCRSRGQLANFQFVPKGRIYVSQELDPVIERYDLAVERHLFKPTGAYLKSISSDSIKLIWDKADALLNSIEVMLKYS